MPPPFHHSAPDIPVKKFSFKEQKELLWEFAGFYPKHKKLLSLCLICIIIAPALSTFMPVVIYKALQDYLPNRNIRMIFFCFSGAILLTGLQIASNYVRMRFGDTLGMRIETDMRSQMFLHLQKMSFSFFDKTKTGHIMSRISNDLGLISGFSHHFPESVLSTTIMLIGGLAVMLYINPVLTLLTLVPLPLTILWSTKILPKMRILFRDIRKDVAEINSNVENSIQGIREVKSYTNEALEIRKFRNVNNTYRKTNEKVYSIYAMFHSGMMFFMRGYNVLFIAAGTILIFYGYATAAELITFFLYSNQITMPVMHLVDCVQMYQQGITAFERFHEIVSQDPEIQDKPNAITSFPNPIKGEIRLEHVTFKYESTPQEADNVLDDVSLHVPSGKMIALVGESGAGKSTIAALIPRFYEVKQGAVLIDGIDIRDLSQQLLRSQIGIVQQTPFLFDTTIRENILFGNPDASETELIEAAKAANIYDFVCSLPDGFDSFCGENGVRLSGGQKQRICLARIFLKNPPILIFDEATSSLDNESEAFVQESVERLCKNRTTIMIAHRLSTVKNASYIFCMKHGKVVEKGTHQELLEKNGYYKELYTMHSF